LASPAIARLMSRWDDSKGEMVDFPTRIFFDSSPVGEALLGKALVAAGGRSLQAVEIGTRPTSSFATSIATSNENISVVSLPPQIPSVSRKGTSVFLNCRDAEASEAERLLDK